MSLKSAICSKKIYPVDYQKDVIKAVENITIPSHDIIFFGSSLFRSLLYAGDIDLFQMVKGEEIESAMKSVIKKLIKEKYIIGDIKAGNHPIFEDFYKYLGKISGCRIVDYNPNGMYKMVHDLEIKGIKLKEPLSIVDANKITFKSWLKLFKEIHQLVTLRWTPDEILKGEKEFMPHYFISLHVATTRASKDIEIALNKIDIYIWINNKFLEITNVFRDEEYRSFYIENIKLNMMSYIFTDKPNYNKALKRAYSIGRIENNPIIEKIYPFLNSNYNLLYSATTDLDVIKTILEFNEKISKDLEKKISITLDTVVNRLSYYYKSNINKYVEEIKMINKDIHKFNRLDLIELLDDIISDLRNIVNHSAIQYMKDNNINLVKEFCP